MSLTAKKSRSFYPALRGVFGDWVFYSCLMSAAEVADKVAVAETIHPSKGLSTLIQRQLKGPRAVEIGDYLIREQQRFFNSMVVAVYGGAPVWHGFSNFKPRVDDISLRDVPEDAEDSVGFLSLSGSETMFALDGQHRLAGIRNALSRDLSLNTEAVSLLVVAHQNTKPGLERTRRLFTTLNKTARPVGKGDIIALDENDAMAIVARQLVDFEPKFSDQRIKVAQTDNVSANDPELTTIGNLYDVLSSLFTSAPTSRSKRELQYIRPSDPELKAFMDIAKGFFEGLEETFPAVRSFFHASESRAVEIVRKHRTSAGGHILFRPIGLRIFAEICAVLMKEGSSLQEAVSTLGKLPTDLNELPYRDVVWRNSKIVANGRILARDLLLYMLGRKTNVNALKLRYSKAIDQTDAKLPALLEE